MKRKIRVAGVLAFAAGTALLATGCSGSGGGRRFGRRQSHHDVLARTRRPGPVSSSGRTPIAAFEKANPNVTIKIQSIQNEDLDGKLQTALNSGDAPDIFLQRGGGKMAAMVNAGQLMDLTGKVIGRDEEQLSARGSFKAETYQGKVYAMPIAVLPGGHLLQQGPLRRRPASPTPPTTIDELERPQRQAQGHGRRAASPSGAKDAWPAAHWYY